MGRLITAGAGGGADGGWGSVRAIADQRDNMMRFMMHGKLMASGEELASKKVVRNSGRYKGGRPRPSPKKIGLEKLTLLGMLAERESVSEEDNTMGYLTYRESRGGSAKARKGLIFTDI